MGRQNRLSQEVRERAVRMVFEHQGGDGSEWEAIRAIAKKLGCSAEALRTWVLRPQVRMARVDAGEKTGISVRRRLEQLDGGSSREDSFPAGFIRQDWLKRAR